MRVFCIWFQCVVLSAIHAPAHYVLFSFWPFNVTQDSAYHEFLDLFFDVALFSVLGYVAGFGFCLSKRPVFCIGRLCCAFCSFLEWSQSVNRHCLIFRLCQWQLRVTALPLTYTDHVSVA